MGIKRSLVALHKQTGIAFETLQDWSELYGWDNKIKERTKEIEKAFDQHYLHKTRNIRNRLIGHMDRMIKDMEQCSLGLPFAVRSPEDFLKVCKGYETLVRASIAATTKGVSASEQEQPKSWSELMTGIEDATFSEYEDED